MDFRDIRVLNQRMGTAFYVIFGSFFAYGKDTFHETALATGCFSNNKRKKMN